MKSYREIFRLIWPIALGMANNALMQFVDRAFLAKEATSSLQAVLPASTLAWVFLSFFQSVVGYSGVFVSQHFGKNDLKGARSSLWAGFWIAVLSGVILVGMIPVGDWIFSFTSKNQELLVKQRQYYDIVMLGGFLVCAHMAILSYFTGCGRTKIVFWVNLAGNVINIALDPLFIFTLKMGISGAAVATVVSQLVQVLILAYFAIRELKGDEDFFDIGKIKSILKFGIFAGGYDVLNMASFTIFVFVTGRVEGIEFAASNACFTINYLLFAPMMGFAIGAQTLVGQALGAGDVKLARANLKKTAYLGLGIVSVFSVIVLIFSTPILSIFAPIDPIDAAKFMDVGFKLLILMAAWMVFDAFDVILAGALKAAGDTKFVFLWMFFCAFLIWLPHVFFVFSRNGTIVELWETMLVYVLIITIGSLLRWMFGPWRKRSTII